jgi:hypothetical protein
MRALRLLLIVAAVSLLAVVGIELARPEEGGLSSILEPVDETSVPPTSIETVPPPPSTTTPLPLVAPDIATLADRTTMTDEARRVFYEADPHLVDKTVLADSCPLRDEVSVLGCFSSGRITILAVTDPRLDGMMETTSAHEMLHAAWSILTPDERDDLASGLHAVYAQTEDADLIDKVESYRRADPSVLDNELHSILGTEVRQLLPELETYYARWFVDRGRVVDLAEAAQSTFDQLEAEVSALDGQLEVLRVEIEQEDARLETDSAEIDALRVQLVQLEEERRIDEYNDAVAVYNTRVDEYNQAAEALQVRVDAYNALVEERNALAAEWSQLSDPIDTSLSGRDPEPAPGG